LYASNKLVGITYQKENKTEKHKRENKKEIRLAYEKKYENQKQIEKTNYQASDKNGHHYQPRRQGKK
jgi:hypothetical protein